MSAQSIVVTDGAHTASLGFGHSIAFGSPRDSANGFLESLRKNTWPEGWSAYMGEGADFRPFIGKKLKRVRTTADAIGFYEIAAS